MNIAIVISISSAFRKAIVYFLLKGVEESI